MHRSAFALVNGSPVDHLSASTPADWWAWIWTHIAPYLPLAWQIVTVLLALASTVISWRLARRGMRALIARAKRNSFEDNLTIVAAGIATGVSATGMWKFADEILHLWWPLRIILFAFIEVAIVTSAVRAKRSMREHFKAGVDGIAVWVLACLTAVLSSLDAASFGEAVFRLAAPLVAAWLWERGMRLERRRMRGTTGINWRLTPERIAVRLGLAEASDRTASEVDAQRRRTRLALAAKRARALRDAGASPRKQAAALARLDKAFEAAAEHTGLGRDKAMQEQVRDEVAALYSAGDLMDVPAASAWVRPVEEPFTRLADETERLNAILSAQHDAKSTIANLAMLAADATGNRLVPSAIPSTRTEVDGAPNGRVDELLDRLAAAPPLNGAPSAFPSASPSTPRVAVERVDEVPNFDVRDPSVYNLELMWSSTTLSALPSTPEEVDDLPDDEAGKASKTEVMRAYWDRMIAQKEYPTPSELARHAGASRSLAAELRAQWVEELTGWDKRRAKRALRDKASA